MQNVLPRYISYVTFGVNWISSHLAGYLEDQRSVQRLLFGYLAVLITYLAAVQLVMPIIVTDTDMWYHLNGGRYFWTTGKVPGSTYFSYLEPVREWTNYFWGFQAIIFKIYEFLGYQGLVIFRTLLFLLTVGVILLFVFADDKTRKQPALFFVLAILMVIILQSRAIAVRPHLISHLCIVLFIYVLQNRPRYAGWLPLVAVFWINLHGVEWVVGALICGAYLMEHIYTSWRPGAARYGLDVRYIMSVLACFPALAINPHGIAVLATSFAHDPDIYLLIKELQPVDPALIYSFIFSFKNLDLSAAVTLLAVVEVPGVLLLVARGRLRISHAIMLLGGVFLLSKGIRFVWEWTLLSLPLVHAVLLEYEFSTKRTPHLSLWRPLVATYFSVMVIVTLAPNFVRFPRYPFEPSGLPTATTEFLKQNHAKGNILVPPNDGGYFQWALYPEMRIHSDMEYPPFTAIDLYTALWAMNESQSLTRLLQRNAIDFIAVKLSNTNFSKVVAEHPEFVPVFIGDSHALYANRNSQAELVARYQLKYLNPFVLKESSGTPEQQVDELKRILAVNPGGRNAIHILVWVLFEMERYQEALSYAQRFVELYPDDPNSHYWVGNTLENLDRCDEAIPYFLKAMDNADTKFEGQLGKHLGTCAYLEKRFDEAYKWFSKGINPYVRNESPEDMYQYAYSAAVTGNEEKAKRLLDLLLWRLNPEEESMKAKAESFKDDLQKGELSDLGIMTWLRSLVR